MKQPLAYRLKPQRLQDVIGQKHLVGDDGIITKCIQNQTIFSMILFGPPGVGKTSLARVLANELNLPFRDFNATTGNKKELDIIFNEAKLLDNLVLIVDEVHRLNKDKQDLLLPYVENGMITLIGATTANPYHAINPAIRSRCHLFEVKALSNDDIKDAIKRALKHPQGLNNQYMMDDDAILKITNTVNGDIRFALNILEIAAMSSSDNHITLDDVANYTKYVNQRTFNNDDGHYNLLSAFQKSIRGSDVNAALYYLALLGQSGDLQSITRRLLVIGYEEVGLANPQLASRGIDACHTALELGLPEALGPLGVHVIDLCLAPKSKAGYDATYKAFEFVNNHAYDMPSYLNYTDVRSDIKYDYNRYDCFHKIQYLPDEIKDIEFLKLGNTRYEKQLQANFDELKRFPRSNNLKKIYNK